MEDINGGKKRMLECGGGREEAGRARRCFVVLRESERERARVVGRRREADSSGRSGWRPGPSGSRARPSVCHVRATWGHKRDPFGFSADCTSCDTRGNSRAGVKAGSQSAARQIMRMPQAGHNAHEQYQNIQKINRDDQRRSSLSLLHPRASTTRVRLVLLQPY